VSISPTFYEQLLRQNPFAKKLQTQIAKVLCTAFKCLQFGFVIFWQRDFGTKAAHKMLVKLTLFYKVGPRKILQNYLQRLRLLYF
jgi:hypothetical protein